MERKKVLVSTAPFGATSAAPINLMKDADVDFTINPFGRKMTEVELAEIIDEFDCLIAGTEAITSRVLANARKLKLIARVGIGLDSVDLVQAREQNIRVSYTPDAPSPAVAELTIGHLLACARMIPKAFVTIKAGEWQKNEFTGHELRGKHLGLVGYGRIAQEVASLAEAFGMIIHTFDPFVSAEDFDTKIAVHEDVIGLAHHCTHLSIHCGLTEETRNIINEKVLDALAKGNGPAVLINCARGGLVDEDAALAALEDGRLDACAFDVYDEEPLDPEHPLSKHDNFIGTPHIGAATIESQERVAAQTIKALLAALDGKPELGWVNKPAESM